MRVLERLKECGVSQLYISGDGAKNQKDRLLTSEVQDAVSEFEFIIIKKRFSDKNQGCKVAVLNGINWFFKHVEQGIILEDDCLPSPYLFNFCDDLLNIYRNEDRVKMIGGNNPLGTWEVNGSHFFSRVGHIWGWATWKDRWQAFDPDLPGFNEFTSGLGFEKAFGPTALADFRKRQTQDSVNGKIDTWDYQWNAHILMEGGLAAIPNHNLVENIGFDESGTHISKKPNWINNKVIDLKNNIGTVPFAPNLEYEMELALSQRSNRPAKPSSVYYQRSGKILNQKLKIVLINSTDKGGGAEMITVNLHRKLLDFGHDSILLVQNKNSETESIIEIDSNIEKQLKQLKPDLIHVHNLHGTLISIEQVVNISSINPTLFTLHDSWLTTGSTDHPFEIRPATRPFLELRSRMKELQSRKSVLADSNIRFTAPSQWLRERFFSIHGIRPYFVCNGIEPIEAGKTAIPSDRFILFVANNPIRNPYKDFDTLVNGWKIANEILGPDGCDLICLGGDPESEMTGENHLFMLGYQSQEAVKGFMEKALLVVQASKQDNAPLTILEAHQAGKHVLCALVGGIPEMLSSTESDWLYESGNSEHLAKQLLKAVRYMDGNSNSSEQHFICAIDEMTETYLGHYHEMTDG